MAEKPGVVWWFLGATLTGLYVGADAAGSAWLTDAEPSSRALRVGLVFLGVSLVVFFAAHPMCGRVLRRRRRQHPERSPSEVDRIVARAARRLAQGMAALALLAGLGSLRLWQAWPSAPPPVPEAWLGRAHSVTLRGQVAETSLDGATGIGPRLVLSPVEIEGRAFSARVALTLKPGTSPPAPGACLELPAQLHLVRGLANPDLPDPTLTWRAAGIVLLGHAKGNARSWPCPHAATLLTRVRRWAFQIHVALAARVREALPARQAAFVLAAALGERHAVPQDVEQGFRVAGATHVLSVSGLHLAAVLAIAFTGLRWLLVRVPRLPLVVAPSAVAAGLGLVFVLAFTLMSGEALATVRASLMAASMLLAFVANRRAEVGRSLAACALLIFVVAPLALLDVSLQLSGLSVAALALAARPRGVRVEKAAVSRWRGILRSFVGRVGSLAAVSLAATLGTSPLVVHVFGEWAPAGVLGNLLLVPLVELAVVPLALAGAGIACAWPACGLFLLRLCGWGSRLAMAIGDWFGHTNWIVHLPSPNGWATALFTIAALAILALVARQAHAANASSALSPGEPPTAAERGLRALGWGATSLMVILGSASMLRGFGAGRRPQDLRITFLDVGQGDAAVLEGPDDNVVVVDGGGSEDGGFDPGEQVVAPFLRRHGVRRVALVILSHPHPDHMNGLLPVLRRFAVTSLWTSGDDGKNPVYAQLLSLAKERGVATPVPAAQSWGGLQLVPVGPFVSSFSVGDTIGPPEGVSVNDASLVVRAAFGGRHLLFAGDIEAQGEAELLGRAESGWSVDADILKVPHHGSRTSSSAALLASVHPCWAVASLGFDNRFGFPHREVDLRYAAAHVPLWRTDQMGAVSFTVTPEGKISSACVRGGACRSVGRVEAEADAAPCRNERPR